MPYKFRCDLPQPSGVFSCRFARRDHDSHIYCRRLFKKGQSCGFQKTYRNQKVREVSNPIN